MTAAPAPEIYDPLAGQRALLSDQAVVHEDGLIVAIEGHDATAFLEALTSQHVENLALGDSTEALVLDPAGHVEGQLALIRTEVGFLSWIPSDRAEGVVQWLDRMRFRMDVKVVVRDDLIPIGAVHVDAPAMQHLREQAVAVWNDPWPMLTPGGVRYGTWDAPWEWGVLIMPADASIAVAVASQSAEDTLRIAAGRPNLRSEWDERVLPHEVGWLRTAVHLDKGCYRGQETVAKVHNLGHPPRRLTLLDLDGSLGVIPSSGALVLNDAGREIGHITVAGMHWQDGLLALALLKRTTPIDASLTIMTDDGPVAAAQQLIVPPDAGGTVLDEVQTLRRARRH